MAYWIFLLLHSYLRWFVLILGIAAVIKAFIGWRGRKPWESSDQSLGMFFIMSIDLQLVVGVLLYAIFSPFTKPMFQNAGTAMADQSTRFWGMEHLVMMLIGVALAHVGRAKSTKGTDPTARHKGAAIFFALAILVILAGIPWPFLAYGRPLLRF